MTGIITHNGLNHYITRCRKIDGNWQIANKLELIWMELIVQFLVPYNCKHDCAEKITTFKRGNYNKNFIPQAVIYIKVRE